MNHKAADGLLTGKIKTQAPFFIIFEVLLNNSTAMVLQKYFSQEAATKAGIDPTRFPETEDEVRKAEATIAKELKSLSFDEHEKILFDFHGLPTTVGRAGEQQASSEVLDQEDPKFLASKLVEFDRELEQQLPEENLTRSPTSKNADGRPPASCKKNFASAYLRARHWNESYIRESRLLFLRAERFDVQSAVQLMIQHFEVKKDLFGDGEILGRDVRLSDLSISERSILELGNMQVLPSRDVAGRTILAYRCRRYDQLEDLARCHWYFVHACLQNDAETQRRGFVVVFFLANNNCQDEEKEDDSANEITSPSRSKYSFSMLSQRSRAMMEDFRVIKRIHYIRTGIPERIVGAHFCFHQEQSRYFVAGVQLFLNSTARARLKTHFGSGPEINFELQTYGIPMECCPMKADGSWDKNPHKEWLKWQSQREERKALLNKKKSPIFTHPTKDSDAILQDPVCVKLSVGGDNEPKGLIEEDDERVEVVMVPGRFDVLFGQNKNIRKHTGNLRALHLVEMHWMEYEQANKYQKTEIADRIVNIVYESQGRFLKWEKDHGGWVQVDHDVAREKVSHYFRYMRSKIPKTETKSNEDDAKYIADKHKVCPRNRVKREKPSAVLPRKHKRQT